MSQWIEVEYKSKKIKVLAEKIGRTLWYHFNGETFSYTPDIKRRGGVTGSADAESVIKSPMPGKILKVAKSIGDTVAPGELVVSMEAMKMEYSLSVGVSGKIVVLSVKEGDLVSLGQVLVEVEPSDEKN